MHPLVLTLGLLLISSPPRVPSRLDRVWADDTAGDVYLVYAGKPTLRAPKAEGQERLSWPRASPDGRTAGWLANYASCCQSYPIPLALVLFRSGSVLHTLRTTLMIWNWAFSADGKSVVMALGTTHGMAFPIEYHRYEVESGRLLETHEADGPDDSGERGPAWIQSVRSPAEGPQAPARRRRTQL
jgi:hypothetical protein